MDAAARRLLTGIYHMLKKDEPYNLDLHKAENAPESRDFTVEQALVFLKSKDM